MRVTSTSLPYYLFANKAGHAVFDCPSLQAPNIRRLHTRPPVARRCSADILLLKAIMGSPILPLQKEMQQGFEVIEDAIADHEATVSKSFRRPTDFTRPLCDFEEARFTDQSCSCSSRGCRCEESSRTAYRTTSDISWRTCQYRLV